MTKKILMILACLPLTLNLHAFIDLHQTLRMNGNTINTGGGNISLLEGGGIFFPSGANAVLNMAGANLHIRGGTIHGQNSTINLTNGTFLAPGSIFMQFGQITTRGLGFNMNGGYLDMQNGSILNAGNFEVTNLTVDGTMTVLPRGDILMGEFGN